MRICATRPLLQARQQQLFPLGNTEWMHIHAQMLPSWQAVLAFSEGEGQNRGVRSAQQQHAGGMWVWARRGVAAHIWHWGPGQDGCSPCMAAEFSGRHHKPSLLHPMQVRLPLHGPLEPRAIPCLGKQEEGNHQWRLHGCSGTLQPTACRSDHSAAGNRRHQDCNAGASAPGRTSRDPRDPATPRPSAGKAAADPTPPPPQPPPRPAALPPLLWLPPLQPPPQLPGPPQRLPWRAWCGAEPLHSRRLHSHRSEPPVLNLAPSPDAWPAQMQCVKTVHADRRATRTTGQSYPQICLDMQSCLVRPSRTRTGEQSGSTAGRAAWRAPEPAVLLLPLPLALVRAVRGCAPRGPLPRRAAGRSARRRCPCTTTRAGPGGSLRVWGACAMRRAAACAWKLLVCRFSRSDMIVCSDLAHGCLIRGVAHFIDLCACNTIASTCIRQTSGKCSCLQWCTSTARSGDTSTPAARKQAARGRSTRA